jgi:hypothetical protein
MSVGIGRVDLLIDERLFAAVHESACGPSRRFKFDRFRATTDSSRQRHGRE